MQKIIGLTYDLEKEYIFKQGDPYDANAEFDSEETIQALALSLEILGYKVIRIGSLTNLIENLNNLKVDLVFNLAEGVSGRNRESQIPIILESLGIPYVGSDGLTLGLALDKVLTKKLLLYEGIPTPRFIVAEGQLELVELNKLKFPLIVKPRWEGSSKGITHNSRVETIEELQKQVDLITSIYKQPALVEEFIRGREYTVAMIGNEEIEILPILQVKINGSIDLGNKFYVYDYVYSNELQYVCPAITDGMLKNKLKDLALRTYRALECKDFGRVDIRVDEQSNPYVLEINPLPSLSKADAYGVVGKYWGVDYSEMIKRILNAALERYGIR